MDLIVGHDLTTYGDDALRAAALLSDQEGGLSMVLVHVITQQQLDKTGAISAAEKQQIAIERAYPDVWKRVEAMNEERGFEATELEIDVVVRTAPVHLVRSQAKIAEILLELAKDFSAPRVVLGRKGRPDCVAEHVVEKGNLEPSPPGAHDRVMVVRVPI